MICAVASALVIAALCVGALLADQRRSDRLDVERLARLRRRMDEEAQR